MTALTVDLGGTLLAAGNDHGIVVVYWLASGLVQRKIICGGQVRALALGDLGSPVVIGDATGRIRVQRRFRLPLEFRPADCPVTALAYKTTGHILAGQADGVIVLAGSLNGTVARELKLTHPCVPCKRLMGKAWSRWQVRTLSGMCGFRRPGWA